MLGFIKRMLTPRPALTLGLPAPKVVRSNGGGLDSEAEAKRKSAERLSRAWHREAKYDLDELAQRVSKQLRDNMDIELKRQVTEERMRSRTAMASALATQRKQLLLTPDHATAVAKVEELREYIAINEKHFADSRSMQSQRDYYCEALNKVENALTETQKRLDQARADRDSFAASAVVPKRRKK